MIVQCVYEHNGADTLLYCVNLPGAYTRGKSLHAALEKMPQEAASYLSWAGRTPAEIERVVVVQEQASKLCIADADSDVLFDSERPPMTTEEYEALKRLALQSAADFLSLYNAIPDKDSSALAPRQTFYGEVPRTARQMYEHTKNVNSYYFGEIGVAADNGGDILRCRQAGFAVLERQADFLDNRVVCGSYDEGWSLRKVLRRFIWHDRIHARAMWRMAQATFGADCVPNLFYFI